MAVRDTAAHLVDGFRRTHARLRPGAERLRSPLHVLHHSLRPRQFTLGADGRGGRGRAPARRQRLLRDRAHRRRYHELRRRSAGRAEARHAGQADPQARAGAQAAAAVVDRFGRGRSRSARCLRRRRTADAASASVAAIGRRSHPQAHEAAASARADAIAFCRDGAAIAARHGVRRRSDRRLSDRDRGDVPAFARPRRGMRADASACLSVLAAAGYAGGADAATRWRRRQRARAAFARTRRAGASRAISTARSAPCGVSWRSCAEPAAPSSSHR